MARQSSKGYDASSVDEDSIENQTKKSISSKLGAAIGIGIALLLICYMSYFPLSIFEKAEEDPETAWSVVADPNALPAEHQKLIEQTQELYRIRRDEIVREIKTGPINTLAEDKCRAMIANGDYGPNAVFTGLEWNIPESEESMDLILSAEEADELLYLYSCLYDMDFIDGDMTTFEGWFYGVDGTQASYELEAFGCKVSMPGKGGYYLPLALLNEAREKAAKAGETAAAAAAVSVTPDNSFLDRMLTVLFRPFITTAYAEETDAYRNAYRSVMADYYSQYGKSIADTVIYTGISDQLSGEVITFSFANNAADVWGDSPNGISGEGGGAWHGTIEEYMGDGAAQEVVKDYNANPFKGRIVVMTDVQEEEVPPRTYEYYQEEYWYRNPRWTAEKEKTVPGIKKWLVDYYDVEKSETITTKYTTYVTIFAFECQELVKFTAKANINASGIANARASLLEIAESQVGVGTAGDYTNRNFDAWCADFVSWCANRAGLTGEDGPLLDASGCAYYHDVLTCGKDVYLGDNVYGRGYPQDANADLAQFGGDGSATARPGDIIFWHNSESWQHIGIVVDVTDTSITIVEGNSGRGSLHPTRVEYNAQNVPPFLYGGAIVHVEYPNYDEMITY